jgi:hypothetical protein
VSSVYRFGLQILKLTSFQSGSHKSSHPSTTSDLRKDRRGSARLIHRSGQTSYGSESIEGQPIQGDIEHGPWGRQYAETADGRKWTRPKDGEWKPVNDQDSAPSTASNANHPLQIVLAIHDQVGDAPDHWSLFVGHEGEPGSEYQVTGKQRFSQPHVASHWAIDTFWLSALIENIATPSSQLRHY